ncbi:hypothetical protein CPSG_03200 [Coccidioides posadasii str. Silveira]|uniref:Uncharacterized protein n=1 Tax=Coccidioides posadasii (strain RMSCC 757 / Silveira) TaxID=443226 RepID=E9D121_COCPS|nr:hypothetical protein CPSG_03200 [Coccidioides posadasii str. Silveira]
MQFKLSIALVAALAALSEASPYRLHASPYRLHPRRKAVSPRRVDFVTMTPSSPYPTGTITDIPTDVPPTGIPTEWPPTGIPTEWPPTGIPTEWPPTGIPTEWPPTEWPTGIPTELPTWFPSKDVPMETLTFTYTLGKKPSQSVVTKTITRPAVAEPSEG